MHVLKHRHLGSWAQDTGYRIMGSIFRTTQPHHRNGEALGGEVGVPSLAVYTTHSVAHFFGLQTPTLALFHSSHVNRC